MPQLWAERITAGLHAGLAVQNEILAGITPVNHGTNIRSPENARSPGQISDRVVARILTQHLRKILPIRRDAFDLQRSSDQGVQENKAGQKGV